MNSTEIFKKQDAGNVLNLNRLRLDSPQKELSANKFWPIKKIHQFVNCVQDIDYQP